MIDKDLKIDILPEEGRKELMDFYEFLLKKYGISVSKKKKNLSKFTGVLKKLSIKPEEYQRKTREEWD
ncbi:DUF2281 domain-containing protein [Persephonella sp.]|jgi:hypothetical protein